MRKVIDEAGGKRLARIAEAGTSFINVTEYPDMEAFHKVRIAMSPQGLDVQRYWDVDVTVGFEPAGPPTR